MRNIKFLDDDKKSYIELRDAATAGNRGPHREDWAIVDGARISFNREASEFPFEKNARLAKYLWSAGDMSPFEHSVPQFRMAVPSETALYLFLFRLYSGSEVSYRYTRRILESFMPPFGFPKELVGELESLFAARVRTYEALYDSEKYRGGTPQVAKELARGVMPFSFISDVMITGLARKWVHAMAFLKGHAAVEPVFEAVLAFLYELGSITAADFERYVANAPQSSLLMSAPRPVQFQPTDEVLDDGIGAVKLLSSTLSDTELADIIRDSQGTRGSDYAVIKELLKGKTRDNLPDELSEIGMRHVLRVPVYVFRQLVRHRRASWYGIEFNDNLFYTPEEWRMVRKGEGHDARYDTFPADPNYNRELREVHREHIEEHREKYVKLVKGGLELRHARAFLPYCFYMTTRRSGDGIDLFNMLNLRCDWHAQWETRMCALRMLRDFAERFPVTARVWYEEYWGGNKTEKDREKNQVVADIIKEVA